MVLACGRAGLAPGAQGWVQRGGAYRPEVEHEEHHDEHKRAYEAQPDYAGEHVHCESGCLLSVGTSQHPRICKHRPHVGTSHTLKAMVKSAATGCA